MCAHRFVMYCISAPGEIINDLLHTMSKEAGLTSGHSIFPGAFNVYILYHGGKWSWRWKCLHSKYLLIWAFTETFIIWCYVFQCWVFIFFCQNLLLNGFNYPSKKGNAHTRLLVNKKYVWIIVFLIKVNGEKSLVLRKKENFLNNYKSNYYIFLFQTRGGSIAFLLVVLAATFQPLESSPQCDHYGGCRGSYPFLPAAPGKTPSCAKPGSTSCDKLEHYPMWVILSKDSRCVTCHSI